MEIFTKKISKIKTALQQRKLCLKQLKSSMQHKKYGVKTTNRTWILEKTNPEEFSEARLRVPVSPNKNSWVVQKSSAEERTTFVSMFFTTIYHIIRMFLVLKHPFVCVNYFYFHFHHFETILNFNGTHLVLDLLGYWK